MAATKIIFGRLFPKTLTSLTSFRSNSTLPGFLIKDRPNLSALKLRNGCDYYPTMVFMDKYGDYHPRGQRVLTKDETTSDFVKTLAGLVGSEEEARLMVDKVHCGKYYTNIVWMALSDELYHRVKALPRMTRVRASEEVWDSRAYVPKA